MQHQRRVGRRMDLRQPFDVEPRSLLVEAVGRTDRHGQRIDAGRFDEPCGLFGRGEASALRLSQFGDVAQLRFDVHAVGRASSTIRRVVETFSSNGRSLASIITESNPASRHRSTSSTDPPWSR